MVPIAPPPPPPAAPKTIALGQTKDEVAAILGQPDKIANLGTKEIDYYTDMKVTFVKGKVTDIQ
jgi:outer membrane protein assembly factor BamE (lipoprotein component of BamABCDE complex)